MLAVSDLDTCYLMHCMNGYMSLFINPMQVGFLLSCSRLYVINSRISSNEIIFKGSRPLIVCANMGLVLCPIPSDNCTIYPFRVLFKYFLRYFISLLILYSFCVVMVWVVVYYSQFVDNYVDKFYLIVDNFIKMWITNDKIIIQTYVRVYFAQIVQI